MKGPIHRREFLRRAGFTGAAAVVAAGLPRPFARADQSLAPFLHGVASGDPLADRVILWTRVTPTAGDAAAAADVPVRLVVARDVDLLDGVGELETFAPAARDWTVKIDFAGLDPYRWYYYAFEAYGLRSLVGRTKTAPTSGESAHLRYGVVSCSNYTAGFFNAYARLAERDDLDAILHLGDYLYEYGNGADRYGPPELAGVRDHEPGHEQVTLTDYRLRHGNYRKDPDLRRLHQLFPFVTTWDDHESTDNSWRDGANNHQPETEGEWSVRKAAAQRAYDEWMPIRSASPAAIYRHLPWGDLVDVIVLDTRLEGRDEQLHYPVVEQEALGGLVLFPDDPNRHIVSPQQMAWLRDRLAASTAQWKIVAQQVVLAQWNAGGLPRLPAGPDVPQLVRNGGNALNPDAWDGYQADRDALFAHVKTAGVDGVVVLTGDVHSSWAFDLTRDPYDPREYDPLSGAGSLGVEFVTPAVTSPPLGATFQQDAAVLAVETAFRADNPQLKWLDLSKNGYLVLDVTPAGVQADWYFVDTVLAPSDAEAHGASWRVNAGTRNLVEAEGEAAPKSEPPAGSPSPEATGAAAIRRGSRLARILSARAARGRPA